MASPVQHSAVPKEHMHDPYRWIVEDDSARLALSELSIDVGKWLKQTGDNTIWELISEGPAVWRKRGISSDLGTAAAYDASGLAAAGKIPVADADGLIDDAWLHTRTCNTVDEMVADTKIINGQVIGVLDYANGNNSGILFFKAVAAGTGTADGFQYIDSIGSPSVQFKQKLPSNVSFKHGGAVGDGVTDDTSAIQVVCDNVSRVTATAGTYIIDSVSLTSSITIMADPGVTFKRKAGADLSTSSYWLPGAAMFELDAEGLAVNFMGAFNYDGNSANQTTTEPTGFFLKTYPQASPSSLKTAVYVENGNFYGGTSGYLLFRGDDLNRRYETLVYLNNCHFEDTVYGKGLGDPSTPTALGYAPTYVLVLDYVKLHTNNFNAIWKKPTGTGQYAATAITATYYGVDYANSGGTSVYMHGTTTIKNVGRALKKYDDDADFTNNAIGAIDMYGNTDILYIENLVAEDCQFVPARAKCSAKYYTINNATLTNCTRGLQVGPSSTGAPETIVNIGAFTSVGGSIPQLEFVGNDAVNTIPYVSIDSAYISGNPTNPESLVNYGAAHFRNIDKLTPGALTVLGAPLRAINIRDVTRSNSTSIIIDGTISGNGLDISGGGDVAVQSFDIRNTAGSGVYVADGTNSVSLENGLLDTVVNYAVFCNSATKITTDNVESRNVSGVDRHIYLAAGSVGKITNNKTDAATPILATAGALYNERDNSWNPVEFFGTSAPVSGTYRVGDKVWNTSPTPSGVMGWVCTTAGSPGTWKTYGIVSA